MSTVFDILSQSSDSEAQRGSSMVTFESTGIGRIPDRSANIYWNSEKQYARLDPSEKAVALPLENCFSAGVRLTSQIFASAAERYTAIVMEAKCSFDGMELKKSKLLSSLKPFQSRKQYAFAEANGSRY